MAEEKQIRTRLKEVIPVMTEYLCDCSEGATYQTTGAMLPNGNFQMVCVDCGDMIYISPNPLAVTHVDELAEYEAEPELETIPIPNSKKKRNH